MTVVRLIPSCRAMCRVEPCWASSARPCSSRANRRVRRAWRAICSAVERRSARASTDGARALVLWRAVSRAARRAWSRSSNRSSASRSLRTRGHRSSTYWASGAPKEAPRAYSVERSRLRIVTPGARRRACRLCERARGRSADGAPSLSAGCHRCVHGAAPNTNGKTKTYERGHRVV